MRAFDIGLSALEACEFIVQTDEFLGVAGSNSNEDFVELMYYNLAGFQISTSDRAYFVSLLQGSGGTLSRGQMLEIASLHPANDLNIDLVGLQIFGANFL